MARRRRPMAEINVVPYVDVTLVLLVIFMATAPLLSQGVEVDLPKKPSDPIPQDDNDAYIVTITEDGSIYVNTGLDSINEKGTQVTIFSLQDQARRILEVRPDLQVLVRADEALDYGTVVGIMTALQRSGATSVGLMTEPPEV